MTAPRCDVAGCTRVVVFGRFGILLCLTHYREADRPKGADTRVVVEATE